MAVGFRKSLFGFNCNDVIDYIEKAQKRFKIKADALSKTADELSQKLDASQKYAHGGVAQTFHDALDGKCAVCARECIIQNKNHGADGEKDHPQSIGACEKASFQLTLPPPSCA